MSTLLAANFRRREGHIAELDGVRGLAILLVLIVHAYYRGPNLGLGGVTRQVVESVVVAGWTGVELFFVLSGFLITSILWSEKEAQGSISFSGFYVKRFARIVPIYYLIVASLALLGALDLPGRVGVAAGGVLDNVWWYVGFASNWSEIAHADLTEPAKLLGVSWSLCIEEQFYLLWPVFLAMLPRKRVVALLAIVLLSLPLVRYFVLTRLSVDAVYHWTFTHVDGLLVGSLVALANSRDEIREKLVRHSAALLAVSLLLAVGICVGAGTAHYSNRAVALFGYAAIALFWGAFLWRAMYGRGFISRLMLIQPLRTLGKYSYFLYLTHWPLFIVASQLPLPSGLHWFVTYVVLMTGVLLIFAKVSFNLLEEPIIRASRRLAARQRSGHANACVAN